MPYVNCMPGNRGTERPGIVTANLGTGRGNGVLPMIEVFSAETGKPMPYRVVARRPGDVAKCYADSSYARERLGGQAELGIDAMCRDLWR